MSSVKKEVAEYRGKLKKDIADFEFKIYRLQLSIKIHEQHLKENPFDAWHKASFETAQNWIANYKKRIVELKKELQNE